MTTVSIIIPALNEAERIVSAVSRALATGAQEVIVVDGGSDDGTLELARAQPCQSLVAPRGRALQQNLGAHHAQGDVLLFLHADTWLDPTGVRQIEAACDDPRVVAGAFRQCIDAEGRRYRLLEWGNALRAKHRGLPYGDQGIFVRRTTFEVVGGFPAVRLMEDLLLMKQLRRQSRSVLLPGPLHVDARRWQRHGVVRQTARNWLLLSAVRLGIHPDRLARFYPNHATPLTSREGLGEARGKPS